MKAPYHYLLGLLIIFSVHTGFSQDLADDNYDKWRWFILGGIGTSNEQKSAVSIISPSGNSAWYVPRVSGSIGTGVSRKFSGCLRLSSGVSYNYYSFKSEPFYQVHIGPGYYHSSMGIKPYITQDDVPSVHERHRGYLSIPVFIEYNGSKTWSPYFKIGSLFSIRVLDRMKTVYVGTRTPTAGETGSISTFTTSGIFGVLGGGIQYSKNRELFTFGLSSHVGVVPFFPKKVSKCPVLWSLQFEIGFHHVLFK
ncbi:MAG: hypothetical protein HWE22_05625 [Flavobacteriales bacterium]|nr:hypothetical protein [Flavobacteriales bacterium]